MKKIAFTLIEVVICIVIIGVLTLVTLNITTKSSSNQYAKLYYAAYDSLVQAVGNAYLDWDAEKNSSLGICIKETEHEYYWSKECWSVYTGTIKGMQCENPDHSITNIINPDEDCLKQIRFYPYNGKRFRLKNIDDSTDESFYYGGILGYPRKYPGFLMGKRHSSGDYMGGRYDGWGTNEAFCKDIVQYYNTIANRSECTSFITGMNNSFDPTIGNGFHKIFCAVDPPASEGAPAGTTCVSRNLSNTLEPSFITSNGQKFYISGITTANIPYLCPDSDENCKKERIYFRFIVVDLNGDSGPNRQFIKGDSYPDIVLFAITDNGYVIPLGLPEFSTVYATAKVYYPEYIPKKSEGGETQMVPNDAEVSTTMDLYTAKLTAWGNTNVQAPELICEKSIIKNIPLTYSDLFYWIALNCGANGCGFDENGNHTEAQTTHPVCQINSGNSNADAPIYADKLMANIVRQFIFKNENQKVFGSRENTYIPTQSSMYLLDSAHGCHAGRSDCKVQIEYEAN